MKKTLLFGAALMVAVSINLNAEDKVWDFSAIFTEDHSAWGSEDAPVTEMLIENEMVIISEKISIDNTASTSMKKWTTGSYHTRLKTGGAGNVAEANAIAIKVAGNSTIQVCAVSSSSSATRKLVVADAQGNIIGSQLVTGNDGKDATIAPPTFEYIGGESVIYIFSANSDESGTYTAGGLNLYMISATNATTITTDDIQATALFNTIADAGISYNGREILNPQAKNIVVYNVLGKQVAQGNSNICLDGFQSGVYLVRAEGIKTALKIRK